MAMTGMVGRLAAWTLVLLLRLEATQSIGPLGSDECAVRYQYEFPPSLITCKANVSVIRLQCCVAMPNNTRVQVIWYWRSRADTIGGSTSAVRVDNSPSYMSMSSLCDREQCPSTADHLRFEIHRLEIEKFSSAFEGDYVCRASVFNESSGRTEQELQPAACIRLLLASEQSQECLVTGDQTVWRCADVEQSPEQCPQQLLPYPVTSSTVSFPASPSITPTTAAPSSIASPSVYHTETSSANVSLLFPVHTTIPSPEFSSTGGGIPYYFIALGILVLLAGAGIATISTLIILCYKRQRRGQNLKSLHSAQAFETRSKPIYTLSGDTQFKLSDMNYANGRTLHNESESAVVSDDRAGSGRGLQRVSTIYSKPVWPTEEKTDPKEHKYANPVTFSANHHRQRIESGEYSYAYQHHVCPRKESDGKASSEKDSRVYQQMGMGDYIHMYSKPSLVLASTPPLPHSSASAEERGYQQLDKETLDSSSTYTKPVQVPATTDTV